MANSTFKNTTKPVTASEVTGKPVNADYPVEQADLVSQQKRLKKAAAAAADALKSPISSALSGPSSRCAPMPQKLLEPMPPLSQIPSPAADIAKLKQSPEIPANQRVEMVQMNDNESILAELRRISAWADMQRRITKWAFIFLGFFIPALVGFGVLMEQRMKTNLDDSPPREKPDWYEVGRSVRSGDFDKATAIGEELILKTPQYPEAHQRLAGAYLAAGNIEKAREHYAEAFRLFPSEENEKVLIAIDKRIKTEKP